MTNIIDPRMGSEMFFENEITSEWLSTKEAAAYLRVSSNALRILVHRGKIKAFKLGSRLRFRLRDLLNSLQRRDN